jgi:hypothetical protein
MGWTRLKQRMQTHGFLERNKNKASDNVVEGGSKYKEEVVVKRGMKESSPDSFGLIMSKFSLSNSSSAYWG